MNKDTKVNEIVNAIKHFFAKQTTQQLIYNKQFESVAKQLYDVLANELALIGYTEPQIKQEIKQRIGFKTESELNAMQDYNNSIKQLTEILRKALNDVFDN